MHCPVCRSKETKVVDSRVSPDGLSIRRRRECEKCEYRFSTSEETEILDVIVVKNNGTREAYSRDKLARGLHKSLEKRPFTADAFKSLLHRIEQDIQKKKKREITSLELGELVMKHLQKFDSIAYIRFASVYRQFQDVDSFQRELNKIARNKPAARPSTKRKSL
ncbi:MAG: transcriptional regulator NrdR [Patescibacteria group bacterium]